MNAAAPHACLDPKDRLGEFFQPDAVDQLQFAPVDLQQSVLLEAAQYPADGLRREAQIVGDVGARHRQLEPVGRETACGEPARQADQERGHALVGGPVAGQQRGGLHRNFMGYTTHADTDLVGLGVSAISHIGDSFSQNPRDLPSWQIALDEGRLPVFRGMRLTEDDQLRADLIQRLMCQGEIPIGALERRYLIDFREYFADALERLQPLVEDGLARIEPDRIVATSRGRLLLRNMAMCFDHYLHTPGAARPADTATPRFSRAI